MVMQLPAIGLGTWGLGGKYERDDSNFKESIEILKSGLSLGYRLIDTAELYGGGLTEEIVGQAIKGFKREEIFLISKVWLNHLAYDQVIKAAEGSLKRLGTDYLDLYLIHWSKENRSEEEVPVEETAAALENLAERGLIKNLGVSNADVASLKRVEKALKRVKLAANQIEYNLYDQSAAAEIVPYCQKQNIKIIANRPLAKGNLGWTGNETIVALSQKYLKTPVQIALNWLICLGFTPIPKAGSIAHLRENYGALGWQLSPEDVKLLNGLKLSR